MTAGGRTAIRGADPNCPVCLGTGTDLVFESECGECWDTSTEDLNDTRHRLAMRYIQSEQREAALEASHERQLATRNDRWERHLQSQYKQPRQPMTRKDGQILAGILGAVVALMVMGSVALRITGYEPPPDTAPTRVYGTGVYGP